MTISLRPTNKHMIPSGGSARCYNDILLTRNVTNDDATNTTANQMTALTSHYRLIWSPHKAREETSSHAHQNMKTILALGKTCRAHVILSLSRQDIHRHETRSCQLEVEML